MAFQAKQVINGTFTEIWLEDEFIDEAKAFQAKLTFNKEDIYRTGKWAKSTKVLSTEGTGSLTLYKVSTRMAKLLQNMLKEQKDYKFKLIGKLADPDSKGCERVVLKEVSFDDLTLMDTELNKALEVEIPFTFEDFEYLDMI